jgi:hypothetical protein
VRTGAVEIGLAGTATELLSPDVELRPVARQRGSASSLTIRATNQDQNPPSAAAALITTARPAIRTAHPSEHAAR